MSDSEEEVQSFPTMKAKTAIPINYKKANDLAKKEEELKKEIAATIKAKFGLKKITEEKKP